MTLDFLGMLGGSGTQTGFGSGIGLPVRRSQRKGMPSAKCQVALWIERPPSFQNTSFAVMRQKMRGLATTANGIKSNFVIEARMCRSYVSFP